MGCGLSKTKAKKRKEKERKTTGCNGSRIDPKERNKNRATHSAEQLQPLSKKFEIERLKGDPKKPSCIYSFEIRRAPFKKKASKQSTNDDKDLHEDEHKVAWRIKKLVLDQWLGKWLKKHKVSSKLYLIDMRASWLYTQFVIEKPKKELDIKFGGQGCCYKGYVCVMVPRLIGSKYVNKKETYQIAIKSLGKLVDCAIQRAVNFLLLADVIASPSFAVTHDFRNIGRFFNVSDERHRRIDHKGACLRSCRGLATSIESNKCNGSGSPGFVLTLAEELAYFFTPINMIELLTKHFKFDVSAPLERNEIEALEWDLVELAVEMRVDNLGNGDKSMPEVHETAIGEVSKKSIREELCDSYDESGNVAGKTTVEELFEREFSHVRLRYSHLPCLISKTGRRMPLEVCWIMRGEIIKNKYPKQEERCDPNQLQLHRVIFEENCAEFTKHYISTFREFGFQLKQARAARAKVQRANQ